MIAKVKEVENTGKPWKSEQYGEFENWKYTFDNGDVIYANHKSTTKPFDIGAEVEYTYKNEDTKTGKVGKPNPNNGNRPKSGYDGFIAGYAARMVQGQATGRGYQSEEEMLESFSRVYDGIKQILDGK